MHPKTRRGQRLPQNVPRKDGNILSVLLSVLLSLRDVGELAHICE